MGESIVPTDREALVDAAIAEYLQGKASASFNVDAWLARHPDAAEELAEFLRDEGVFGEWFTPLRPPADSTQSHHAHSASDSTLTVGAHPMDPTFEESRCGVGFEDFELLDEIARGGMGVVYRARQKSLNRIVALKMVLAGQFASRSEVAQLYREAEAAAGLDHPNIVPVYEVGEHDARPFFAMKLVPGGSLADHAADLVGKPREVAALVATVARAVYHAHQRGILHRDLKPSNILLDGAGVPHVTDFGLARKLDAGASVSGAVAGTPSYMAPEQARGEKSLTTAVDVYGLGGVLYFLLTGVAPFKAESTAETLLLVLASDPIAPRKLQLTVPRDLETICLKCLAKDPAKRYGSAAELANDLDSWLAGEPIRARPTGRVERLAMWVRRKPTLAAAYSLTLAIVALVGVGTVITSLWRAAEGAKGVAEIAKIDAEDARDALAVQKKNADDARQVAESARDGEKTARAEADRQRDRFERSEYGRTMQVAHQEWRENNVPAALALLNGIRPDFRGWEWQYVHRLCHAHLLNFTGHTTEVTSSSFSPDGSRIVTGSADKTARVWGATTKQPILTLTGHTGSVKAVSWSPDGSRIVTGSADSTVRVWDAASGKEVLTLKGHSGYVASVSWSPDGSRIVTGASDRTARVWDATTGKEILSLKRQSVPVTSAMFSPDGSRIVTTGLFRTAKVWDATSGVEVLTLTGHSGMVMTASFSPDGLRLVTGAADNTAKIWDATTGQETLTLTGHTGHVKSARFSPDGSRIVTAGWSDRTARMWDVATGKEVVTLKGHTDAVTSASWSPDGSRIVTGSSDKSARIWDPTSGVESITPRGRHIGEGHSTWWSPDGTRLVTGSEDGLARVLEATTGRELLTLKGHASLITSASWSPDGSRVVTGSQDKTVRVWNATTGQQVLTLKGHAGAITLASFSPDGIRIMTRAMDKTAKVWDATSGRELLTLKGHTVSFMSSSWSPDGSRIVTGASDMTARVWDAATGKELLTLTGHAGAVEPSFNRSVATVLSALWSPDGSRIVTIGGWDPTARVWDATTGVELLTLKGHTAPATSARFSPDGSRIVTGSHDSTVRVWDAVTGRKLFTLTGHTGAVTTASFSPDESRIVTASADKTARVWDATSGVEVLVLKGHSAPVITASFSPDGSRIVTGVAGRKVILSGQFATFTPDGSRLVTGGQENTAKVWDARPVNRDFLLREVAPAPHLVPQ